MTSPLKNSGRLTAYLFGSAVAAAGLACSSEIPGAKKAAESSTAETSHTAATSDASTDDENIPSDRPAEVSGAFLTKVGPTTEQTPAAGNDSFGIGLIDAGTNKKALGDLRDVYIDVIDRQFNVTHPALTAAPAESPWHGFFMLPHDQMADVIAIVMMAKVSGASATAAPVGTSTTSAYNAAPAVLTAADVKAALPVSVNAAPPNDGIGGKIAAVVGSPTGTGTPPSATLPVLSVNVDSSGFVTDVSVAADASRSPPGRPATGAPPLARAPTEAVPPGPNAVFN